MFGLDTEDVDGNDSPSGDGVVDIIYPIINPQYGEIWFPTHLPFAYQEELSEGEPQWGTNIEDIGTLLNTPLLVHYDEISYDNQNEFTSELSTGPAMYYSVNNLEVLEESVFLLKVKY